MSDEGRARRQAFDDAGIRAPNLFIVGAPKCGTTSMAASLERHPSVFFSPTKEPHFFGRDLLDVGAKPDVPLEGYMALFATASGQPAVGEASVWYLRSSSAAQEIHDFDPDARIVIMLRDPVDLLRSFHGQALRSGFEQIRDLRRALEAEPERRAGRNYPSRLKYPGRLWYSELIRFGSQVERYVDLFGRERVHVVLFEDLVGDPVGSMRAMQVFLDVPVIEDLPLVHANEGVAVRSVRLQSLVRQPPASARSAVRKVLPRATRARIGRPIVRTLERVNVGPRGRTSVDPTLRAELVARATPEIEHLSRILDRDLSAWLR